MQRHGDTVNNRNLLPNKENKKIRLIKNSSLQNYSLPSPSRNIFFTWLLEPYLLLILFHFTDSNFPGSRAVLSTQLQSRSSVLDLFSFPFTVRCLSLGPRLSITVPVIPKAHLQVCLALCSSLPFIFVYLTCFISFHTELAQIRILDIVPKVLPLAPPSP